MVSKVNLTCPTHLNVVKLIQITSKKIYAPRFICDGNV